MPATPVVIAIAAAVVLAVAVALLVARRNAAHDSSPDLPPPPGGTGERAKVRVLPSAENAREARTRALSAEMESLQREAHYAEQRGLDRRAQRLRAMIDDRRRQLESRGGTETR